MKWPLRYDGATYLRNVTDTVQTVHINNIGMSIDVAVGCMQGSIV